MFDKTPLWSSQELIEATNGQLQGQFSIFGVCIDSRYIKSGDLFVAICGLNQNGHDYVVDAFLAGAELAIVQVGSHFDDVDESRLLYVEDTQKALEDLGKFARERMQGKVIAITGSCGKTSVKDGLYLALSASGNTHVSEASYNNLWGVPLSLARMPADTDFGVFEIGMNHQGEVTALVSQIRPHIALITTVAPAHIEHFESLEAIALAKAEIFSNMMPESIAILPYDNQYYSLLKDCATEQNVKNITCFGESEDCDVRLIYCTVEENYSQMSADIFGESIVCKVGAAGYHWVLNALMILSVVKLLEANMSAALSALSEMQASIGRGRRYDISLADGELTVLDESYNANPISMSMALSLLGQFQGRRIAVLGDMNELGTHSHQLHYELLDDILEANIDMVLTIGTKISVLSDVLPKEIIKFHAETLKDLIEFLAGKLSGGDVVMVKGSNSMNLSRLVSVLQGLGINHLQSANEGLI